MKLVHTTHYVNDPCRICGKINTKLRRGRAEVERINRWTREGWKNKASLELSENIVLQLDKEIQELEQERSSRNRHISGDVSPKRINDLIPVDVNDVRDKYVKEISQATPDRAQDIRRSKNDESLSGSRLEAKGNPAISQLQQSPHQVAQTVISVTASKKDNPEISFQTLQVRQNDARNGLWTEIVEDLVSEEAIKECGYKFSRSGPHYYVHEYLQHVSQMTFLLNLQEH